MGTGQPAPYTMRSAAPTWQVLKQYVEEQIGTGAYPVGSWLPSVRDLAGQLNVNRNTVSKVYQALSRDGVLEVARGKGVRVSSKPTEGRSAEARIDTAIASLVQEAALAGVSRSWLLGHVEATVARVYGNRLVRTAFIECTPADARHLAGDVARHLSVAVMPIDLTELEKNPDMAREFDLVATTFFHLQEVSAILPDSVEPVGIHHAVSHESILAIARLRPGSTIVIVCPNDRTLDRIKGIVETYARGQIFSFKPDDEHRLRQALAVADVVVDVALTHDVVTELAPELPAITVSFHIEPQSMAYLREALQRIARDRAPR